MPEPPNTQGLYPYQADGARWLRARARALLADEMGTGKTVQVLRALRKGSATLIICPASLRLVWRDECTKWRPDLRPVVLKAGKFRAPNPGELAVCSYESLPEPQSKRWLVLDSRFSQASLVLDEAHYCKSPHAERTQKARLLARQCASTWLLTGTPMLGQPSELWAVLTVAGLERKAFGTWERFAALFGVSVTRWGATTFDAETAAANAEEIRACLRRVMLRRRRADVLPDLPGKVYQDIPIPPPAELLGTLNAIERDWQRSGTEQLPPFEMLSAVRAELARGRIPALLEHVATFEGEAVPLVVFSSHVEPIAALEGRTGWRIVTGATHPEERRAAVAAFQAGELRGIALTIAAGGVGLTLTHGAHVLFVDLEYTPALNAQAEDRVVRIGSTARSAQIMRMVADHPVDRRVLEILDKKQALIASALG